VRGPLKEIPWTGPLEVPWRESVGGVNCGSPRKGVPCSGFAGGPLECPLEGVPCWGIQCRGSPVGGPMFESTRGYPAGGQLEKVHVRGPLGLCFGVP
jgi:hypothetical protein